jgi:hypothetical protein
VRTCNGTRYGDALDEYYKVKNQAKIYVLLFSFQKYYYSMKDNMMGRDSVVGIATCYGLDGPGIEHQWRRDFPDHPDRPRDTPSLLYNGYQLSFPGIKRPGRGDQHPLTSRPENKERAELCLTLPLGLHGLI